MDSYQQGVLRWQGFANIALEILRALPKEKKSNGYYKNIRSMSKNQLNLFMLKARNRRGRVIPFDRIASGKYNRRDVIDASRITYARNRLRLM